MNWSEDYITKEIGMDKCLIKGCSRPTRTNENVCDIHRKEINKISQPEFNLTLEDVTAILRNKWPDEILDMISYAQHTHVNNQKDDICKKCGHDLRHRIHIRMPNAD